MTKAPRRATNVDAYVSLRLKAARKQAGISQTEAGERINITFQQMQKYEGGKNRISAGKLFALAGLYEVPVSWFFEGLENNPTATSDVSTRLLASVHGAELAENFLAIKSSLGRAAVVQTAAAFAAA